MAKQSRILAVPDDSMFLDERVAMALVLLSWYFEFGGFYWFCFIAKLFASATFVTTNFIYLWSYCQTQVIKYGDKGCENKEIGQKKAELDGNLNKEKVESRQELEAIQQNHNNGNDRDDCVEVQQAKGEEDEDSVNSVKTNASGGNEPNVKEEELEKEKEERNSESVCVEEKNNSGRSLETLKIKYDQIKRERKKLEKTMDTLKNEYQKKSKEKKAKYEDERRKWEEERKDLSAKLGVAIASSEIYNSLLRDHEEDRRKWEEEKNDLIAKMSSASTSSDIYECLLHDFGY